MKIIRNKFIPFRRFEAINLFGVLFCHPDSKITPQLINHERIHTAQMLEMLVVGFYLWYTVEWLVRLLMRGNAYLNISFEREAYRHMYNLEYLEIPSQGREKENDRGFLMQTTPTPPLEKEGSR